MRASIRPGAGHSARDRQPRARRHPGAAAEPSRPVAVDGRGCPQVAVAPGHPRMVGRWARHTDHPPTSDGDNGGASRARRCSAGATGPRPDGLHPKNRAVSHPKGLVHSGNTGATRGSSAAVDGHRQPTTAQAADLPIFTSIGTCQRRSFLVVPLSGGGVIGAPEAGLSARGLVLLLCC
jgi:hypothetical protein